MIGDDVRIHDVIEQGERLVTGRPVLNLISVFACRERGVAVYQYVVCVRGLIAQRVGVLPDRPERSACSHPLL